MLGAGLGILGGAAALGAMTAGPAEAAASNASFYSLGPQRVVDSRTGQGTTAGKITKGQTRTISLTNTFVSGFQLTAILNLTVTGTEGNGFLTAWESGLTRPGSSNINWWGKNQTYGNMAIVGLRSSDVTFQLYCNGTGAATHFLVDILGYFFRQAAAAGAKSPAER